MTCVAAVLRSASAHLLGPPAVPMTRTPSVLGPLAGDQADAARGRVEQDGVAALDAARAQQQVLAVIPFSIIAAAVRSSMPAGSGTSRAAGTIRDLGVGAQRPRTRRDRRRLTSVTPGPTASTTPAAFLPGDERQRGRLVERRSGSRRR